MPADLFVPENRNMAAPKMVMPLLLSAIAWVGAGFRVVGKVKPKCSRNALIESLMKGWGLDDCFAHVLDSWSWR